PHFFILPIEEKFFMCPHCIPKTSCPPVPLLDKDLIGVRAFCPAKSFWNVNHLIRNCVVLHMRSQPDTQLQVFPNRFGVQPSHFYHSFSGIHAESPRNEHQAVDLAPCHSSQQKSPYVFNHLDGGNQSARQSQLFENSIL